jgi:hypothetical protein
MAVFVEFLLSDEIYLFVKICIIKNSVFFMNGNLLTIFVRPCTRDISFEKKVEIG